MTLVIITTQPGADLLYPFGEGIDDKPFQKADDHCYNSYSHPIAMFGKTFKKIYVSRALCMLRPHIFICK